MKRNFIGLVLYSVSLLICLLVTIVKLFLIILAAVSVAFVVFSHSILFRIRGAVHFISNLCFEVYYESASWLFTEMHSLQELCDVCCNSTKLQCGNILNVDASSKDGIWQGDTKIFWKIIA